MTRFNGSWARNGAIAGVGLAAGTVLLLSSSSGNAATVSVEVGNDWFCDPQYASGVVCVSQIDEGDTIQWTLAEGAGGHDVAECPDGSYTNCTGFGFESDLLFPGLTESFSWTFDEQLGYGPGTYYYYCSYHPTSMFGQVDVEAAPTPSPSPSPSPTPSASPSAPPSPTPSLSPSPSPSPTPTGPVTASASPSPSPSATPSSTPVPGSPSPTPTSSASPTPGLDISGDADCDGDVDESDVIAVLLGYAGLESSACADNGDVDCDGDRDPLDALAILRHSAGLGDDTSGCAPIGEPR
jgi:hypothetical protein